MTETYTNVNNQLRLDLLREALPYIQRFKSHTFVVKLSGKVTDDRENLTSLAEELALLHQVGIRICVVHGGGKQLSELATKLGIEQTIIEGRRVTDDATLEMAKMIFAGKINTDILAALRHRDRTGEGQYVDVSMYDAMVAMTDLVTNFWYILVFVPLIVWQGFKYARKQPNMRYQLDRLKLKLPVFGSLFHKVALSRFTRNFGVLLRAGVPILHALEITSETVNNGVMADAIKDVQASVKEGESIAGPLTQHAVFPPMVVQMIAVGEETGAIDEMLLKISEFYDQEVAATTEALTALLEPVMIAVLGGLVGGMVIALYMPMFMIFELIE